MPRSYLITGFTGADRPSDLAVARRLVCADVLARHRRMRGDRVRFALGDHVELREPLSLSSTDVLADSGWQRRWSDADRRMDVRPATDNDPWPARLPPPTEVVLVDAPAAAGDPAGLVREHGTDAVRWWLLRVQGTTLPRTAKDLNRGLGALVDRIAVLVHRYRQGHQPTAAPAPDLDPIRRSAPDRIAEALAAADFPGATEAVARIVTEADRYFDRVRPWELARAERAGDHAAGRDLDAILAALLAVARVLATELTPFLPDAAARITGRCVSLAGPLAQPRPLFGTTRAGIG